MAQRKRSTSRKAKWHSNEHEPFTFEQRLNVCRKWLWKYTDTYIDWSEGQKVVSGLLMAHFPFEKVDVREGTAIHLASRQILATHKSWRRKEQQKAAKRTKRGRGRPKSRECVYVVGPKDPRFVKIGRSTNLRRRLATLQTGFPEELYIYAVLYTNDMGLEGELHKRFADYRTNGEWFAVEGAVAEWLDSFDPPKPAKDW